MTSAGIHREGRRRDRTEKDGLVAVHPRKRVGCWREITHLISSSEGS